MGWEDLGAGAVPGRPSLEIWCSRCGEYKRMPEIQGPGVCPDCRMPMTEMRCNRCGHTWWLRAARLPKVCPACCSPYYDRPRKRQAKGDGQ